MRMLNKIKDNNDKRAIKKVIKMQAKHRCPNCKRYTVFKINKDHMYECLWCHHEICRSI